MQKQKTLLLYAGVGITVALLLFIYLFLQTVPPSFTSSEKVQVKRSNYNFSSQLHQANTLYKNKRFKEALDTIQSTPVEMLKDDQRYAIEVFKASCYKALGLYQTALSSIEQSLQYSEKPFAYFLRGVIYRKLGDQEKALINLERCYRLDPFYAPAYETMGDIWFNLGDYEKAIDAYAGMGNYTANPVSGTALLKKALCHFITGEVEDSLYLTENYLKKIKNKKYLYLAYFLKALAGQDAGTEKESDNFFDMALSYSSAEDSSLILYYHALFLINRERYQDAISKLNQLRGSDKYSSQFVRNTLGNIHYFLGNYNRSYQFFKNNRRKKPRIDEEYNFAVSAYKIKRYREAIDGFDKVLLNNVRDEYNLSSYIVTALSYYYLKQPDQALRIINAALADHGERVDLVKVLGYITLNTEPEKFFDTMNLYFEKPEYEELNLLLSDYYTGQSRYDLALEILMEYIQKNNIKDHRIYYNIGWLQAHLRKYDNADFYFRQALKGFEEPADQLMTLNNLAWVRSFGGNLREGLQTLEKANETLTKNPVILYNTALLYKSGGQRQLYSSSLQKADTVRENYKSSRFYSLLEFELGQLAENEGNRGTAKQHYRRSLENDPANKIAEFHFKNL